MNRLMEILKTWGIDFHLAEDLVFPSALSFLGARAGQQLNRLTVYAEELESVRFSDAAPDPIEGALRSLGKPVDSEIDSGDPENGYCFKTRAGWLNANPAVICVFHIPDDDENAVRIVAFAREGWINQKTAAKAVARFKKALTDKDVGFNEKSVLPVTRIEKL